MILLAVGKRLCTCAVGCCSARGLGQQTHADPSCVGRLMQCACSCASREASSNMAVRCRSRFVVLRVNNLKRPILEVILSVKNRMGEKLPERHDVGRETWVGCRSHSRIQSGWTPASLMREVGRKPEPHTLVAARAGSCPVVACHALSPAAPLPLDTTKPNSAP